jgi:hypothetical protein
MFFLLQNQRTRRRNGAGSTCRRGARGVVLNAEMITTETVPGIWEGGMKYSSGRGEIKYGIFDTLKTFANTPIYHHPTQQ